MSIPLATLVSRLETDVPARNSVPAGEQYERMVRDAVTDYSRRNPLTKLTTLSIVSGIATYDLPEGFIKIILLESLTSPDGVIVTGTGLIPVSATYNERHYIVAGQITFDPTPTYTVERDLWYAAAHVLDSSDTYDDMGEDVVGLVLLKAAAGCLQLQANSAAQEAWQYAIGDERVNKEKLAATLAAQAQEMERRYRSGIEAMIGPVGMRANYNWLGR